MSSDTNTEGFWQKLFRIFHEKNRGVEPADFREYRNIRNALYSLRTFTGMTGERLAIEIGMSPSALNMLESRGGVMHPNYCAACRQIALDFFYPQLAEFFKLEGMNNTKRVRKPKLETEDDQIMFD
jgi:hypothetical protein